MRIINAVGGQMVARRTVSGFRRRLYFFPPASSSASTPSFHSSHMARRAVVMQDAELLTGFDIQVLGSAAKMPTIRSSCPCIGVRVGARQMLFDCGEGTQRQFIHSILIPSKVQGIFITHMHGDHVFGLPGMLLSFLSLLNTTTNNAPPPSSPSSSSHAQWADIPKSRTLRVYGPVGLYNYVCMTLNLCEAKVGVNLSDGRPVIVVHELVGGEQFGGGGGGNGRDRRAAFVKRDSDFAMPGVVSRAIRPDADGFWTIPPFDDEVGGSSTVTPHSRKQNFVVRAGQVKHTVPTFGYIVQEDDKPGKVDVAQVRALGLSPGPAYKDLTEGRDVVLPDGKGVIRAREVVGPRRRGRKLAVLGDTCDPFSMSSLVRDADVLFHEATLENEMQGMAIARGHSTPSMAAMFAKHVRARRLVLTHFSNRYTSSSGEGREEGGIEGGIGGGGGGGGATYGPGKEQQFQARPRGAVARLLQQAVEALGDERRVLVAEDFLKIHVPPEGFHMLPLPAAAAAATAASTATNATESTAAAAAAGGGGEAFGVVVAGGDGAGSRVRRKEDIEQMREEEACPS